MGYDRCVGALAIVLGVGAALVTASPVALAQPSDTESTSNSTSPDGSGSPASTSADDAGASSPTSAPRSPSGSNSAASEEVSTAPTGGSSAEDPSAPADPGAGAGQSADVAYTAPAGSDTGQDPESEPTPEPTGAESGSQAATTAADRVDTPETVTAPKSSAEPQPDVVATSTGRRLSSYDSTPPTPQAKPSATSIAGPASVEPAALSSAADLRTASLAATAPESSPTEPVTTASATIRTETLTSVSQPSAPRGTIADVVSTLLSWVGLAPSMSGDPAPPIQIPVLWGVVAWVRREINQMLSSLAQIPAQHLNSLEVEPLGPNLLVNPGAEVGDASLSGYSSVTVPGWSVTGTPTVIQYGTLRRLPWPLGFPGPTLPEFLGFPQAACAPPDSGGQFFGGGNVATSSLTQTVDLSAAEDQIDSGAVPYTLSGWLGGYLLDPSAASVTVNFFDADQRSLGTGRLRPVTVLDRWFRTGLLARETSGTIPMGTRSAQVVVTFTDCNPVPGHYNNAYADNLSFTVGADLPAPPPPMPPDSRVRELDHVFMVYLENKGFKDIVGSPNAPYINSLINAYGVGTNYYALTHPSSPNYYPILGGSDFGLNYNCPSNCFDKPNLADSIEAAGKTWAGYLQGGGGYDAVADLPFLAFSDIYNNPARVAAHLFDLAKLAQDLAVPADAPDFAWLGADDATNMEGPTDTLTGIIQWAISELTDHQYNVAAGDKWLQDTLGVVLNSPTWKDTTQKSAVVVTFDEDNNNLSLGIGNQGNHITTVVIPSQGAVNGGMRDGHFVVDAYNNHYSLLRTIEDALGLGPLTNNDRYAEPMNDYWKPPITV